MRPGDTNEEDARALALRAIVWTLTEPERAMRFVSLTGLAPADLRTRIGEPALLAASIAFLEAHEPDLIACAAAIDSKPATLVRAREALESE